MPIPTEPIGSIPRPPGLVKAIREFQEGRLTQEKLSALYEDALRDTIQRFEATGSPAITDGEQTKPSFATYPIHGLGREHLLCDRALQPAGIPPAAPSVRCYAACGG